MIGLAPARWFVLAGADPTPEEAAAIAAFQAEHPGGLAVVFGLVTPEERPSERMERHAVEMAAAGHVSGTLAEWPALQAAFRTRGWDVPPTVGAAAMRGLAEEALAELTSRAERRRHAEGR